ncbi:MAG: tetratricopeptide repeat protein [Pseudomonadota bacterium]
MFDDAATAPSGLTPEARDRWRACVRAFLAHGRETPVHLAAVIEAAPAFATAHAAQGLMMMMLGRRELGPAAQAALERARAARAEGAGCPRSADLTAALEDFLAGRMRAAADRLDDGLARRPGDALSMKLAQGVRFMLGDAAGMRESAEAAAQGFGEGHPHRGYFLGCRAFAREETGDYAAAEAFGREGLELAPDDAWGLHAVAHVMDMTGRAEDGLRWLTEREASWAHCSNFGYHVWWHMALFLIERGDLAGALRLYDEKVRPEPTDDYRDIANAASLLVRLEIEGASVGERWEALGELCATRVEDGCVVFADLHYLLSLHGAGREAEAQALTARIAVDAQGFDHDQHEVCAIAGLPMARGLNAFRRGAWAQAARALRLALPTLPSVGGSHAQRDVFERLAIEAAVKAGACDAAEEMLAARSARRGAEDGFAARRRAAISRRRAEAAAAPRDVWNVAATGGAR